MLFYGQCRPVEVDQDFEKNQHEITNIYKNITKIHCKDEDWTLFLGAVHYISVTKLF